MPTHVLPRPRTTLLILALLCIAATAPAADTARVDILARFPHDSAAFTQGLLIHDGALYESTGRYARSTLRRVEFATGEIERSIGLARRYFAEGLALVGDRLYQLTWKAGRVFVYDRQTFERIGSYTYRGQGWGLTWDGKHLIMSDGSATLRFIDASDFSVTERVHVHDAGRPIDKLNELEYVDGEIWANIWFSDRIVRIEPNTGRVLGFLDAAPLRAALPDDSNAGVLNGIAWDATSRRLFVTGKNWPRLFELAWPPGVGGE